MTTADQLLSRITIHSDIMVGKPTIRGLRITVEQILTLLSSGIPQSDILDEYPELEAQDFQAVFAYASTLVQEEQVFPVKLMDS